MPFWSREANLDGSQNAGSEKLIDPRPTFPDYPDRFPYSVQETDGGASVRQRTKKQPKEMRWVWLHYTPTVPRYEDQYWYFFRQQSHIRKAESKSPYMYLKEDVTQNFGTWNGTTGKLDSTFIRVLITYVGRKENKDGGNVRYDETEIRFVIADDTLTDMY